MCGFIAVFDKTSGVDRRLGRSILDAGELLAHRGPDDWGQYFDEHVGFYFRRLSIIDLSANAHQPYVSHDGKFVLVFNGEIYNYRELRLEMQERGHRFDSESDTEVLMACLQERGPDCLPALRGMFALALWSKTERSLLMARDRFGIKPLYVCQSAGAIVAASEIKSILAFAPGTRRIDERSAFKYLARNFVDDTSDTFFPGVKSLRPGTWLRTDLKGVVQGRYWTLRHDEHHAFDGEHFRHVFDEAVSLHTRSDVPISATLSGGMDSTSIVCAAARLGAVPGGFGTYTVLPPGTIDETRWVDATVAFAGTSHEYVSVAAGDFGRVVDDIIRAHDEPFQYASCVYQFLLRRRLQEQGLKVLLVGEGADEVLSGYRRMFFTYLHCLYGRTRNSELEDALVLGRNLFGDISYPELLRSYQNYVSTVESGGTGQENLSAYDVLRPEMSVKYADVVREPMYINQSNPCADSFFDLLRNHLFVRNLPFTLRMEDRNSMAFGIESRVPFLDHVFVEMAFSHDPVEFMRHGLNKSMLRRAMRGYIPAEVCDRPGKSNRPGSHAELIYGPLKGPVEDAIRSTSEDDPFWSRAELAKRFRDDASVLNGSRAEFWFRYYVLRRWVTLLGVEM